MIKPRYANGHPIDDQRALAQWMRYPSVDAMDRDHDGLHQRLCDLLGVPSLSLRKARGERLTKKEESLAACEEAAVLHVQRWAQWLRLDLERPADLGEDASPTQGDAR